MKILQLNATNMIGSTGKIVYELNNVINENDNTGFIVSAYSLNPTLNNSYCLY